LISKQKKPLKRFQAGVELEFFLVDGNGIIVPKADELLKRITKKFRDLDATYEGFQELLEIRSYSHTRLRKSLLDLLKDVRTLSLEAGRMGLHLFPLGTYPGSYFPTRTQKKRYKIHSEVFGGERYYRTFGKICGFHFHYSMPKGVFDYRKRFLRTSYQSANMERLLSSFNFLVAADPAIATLLQSSPFIDQRFVAKDSRLVISRANEGFLHHNEVWSGRETLVRLPSYFSTAHDLVENLNQKHKVWVEELVKHGFGEEARRKERLDRIWAPVKVNKIGTLEARGMDMNHPKYVAPMAVLLKHSLAEIQERGLRPKPCDYGIKEPFKVEGDRLLVPPSSYVRNTLQPLSAYMGFEDKLIHNYVRHFLRFAKNLLPRGYDKAIAPLQEMVSRKKTVSDKLLERVKKMGYALDNTIPQNVCHELALHTAEKMSKELDETIARLPEE